MDKRKVAAIVEEFIDDIRKFNELKDEIAALQHEAAELREELIRGFDEENFFNITIEKALSNIDKEGSNVDIDEDSAKLDAAVLKMRKLGKFIKSNAVNGDYVLSLHLHDEKMLYKEYGGSPFDLDLFDIGKDENDRLLHQVYVPMVIKRQWILSVLVMKLKKVDVYDDFSICSTDLGLTIMDTLLSSMDNAFKESRSEAFGPGWKFFDFVVAEAHDHRRCLNPFTDSEVNIQPTQEITKSKEVKAEDDDPLGRSFPPFKGKQWYLNHEDEIVVASYKVVCEVADFKVQINKVHEVKAQQEDIRSHYRHFLQEISEGKRRFLGEVAWPEPPSVSFTPVAKLLFLPSVTIEFEVGDLDFEIMPPKPRTSKTLQDPNVTLKA
uniref:Uncharacterized protein n=1 Tax=Cannabis sativa TaxID=3483 RepID=A0A803P946_CANSA